MYNVVVGAEVNESGDEVACAKLSAESWELNIRATASDFLALRNIVEADWSRRASLQVGTLAGSTVFWAYDPDDETVAVLVGPDDESWDLAVQLPVGLVHELARQCESLAN